MADDMMNRRAGGRGDERERTVAEPSGGGRGDGHVSQPLNRVLAKSGLSALLEARDKPEAAPAVRVSGPGVTVATKAAAARKRRGGGRAGQCCGRWRGRWRRSQHLVFGGADEPRDGAGAVHHRPDGRLYWRDPVGRRRPEAGGELYRKSRDDGPIWTIQGGSRANADHMRRYLVWNWHFGGTDRVLFPKNGNTLDDRIENIRLGDRLPGFGADALAAAAPVAEAVPAVETASPAPAAARWRPCLSPNLIARAYELPPQQEAILARVWAGQGQAGDRRGDHRRDVWPTISTAGRNTRRRASISRRSSACSGSGSRARACASRRPAISAASSWCWGRRQTRRG